MKNNNDQNQIKILLYLGLFIVFALCPPIGIAIVLSDGTVEGFLGCLAPIIALTLIAIIIMTFQ